MRKKKLNTSRKDVQAQVKIMKATFESAAPRAAATQSKYDQGFVDYVLAQFDALQADVDTAETQDQLDAFVRGARSLVSLRAYVCPESEIASERAVGLVTLSEWGLPESLIERYREAVAAKLDKADAAKLDKADLLPEADVKVARGALYILFAKQNEWAAYIEVYNKALKRIAAQLLASVLFLSLMSALMLWWGWVVWGLFTAGVAGACTSVLARMPGLSVWGEYVAYRRTVLTRIAVGAVSGMIGSGLLVSGLIAVSFGSLKFPDMVVECTEQWRGEAKTAADVAGAPGVDGNQWSSWFWNVLAEQNTLAEQRARRCPTTHTLVLMAIAMILGFSERVIYSFQETLLGSNSKGGGTGRAATSS